MTEELEVLKDIDSTSIVKILNEVVYDFLVKSYKPLQLSFSSTIEIPADWETLTYSIPEQSQAWQKAHSWSFVPTITNLSINDFFMIYFLILNEISIIFVSKHMCLLTSSIHTFLALLHPFAWPHPIIYTLPESLLDLLDSPVPFIVGLNRSETFITETDLKRRYPNYVFILLDTRKIICENESQLKITKSTMPKFNDLQKNVTEYYQKINPEGVKNNEDSVTQIVSNTPNKSIFQQQAKNDKIQQYNAPSSNGNSIIKFMYSDEDLVNSQKIINIIMQSLINNIINNIPSHPIFNNNDKTMINYQAVNELVIKKATEHDQQFLKNFTQSQIFSYYLDRKFND